MALYPAEVPPRSKSYPLHAPSPQKNCPGISNPELAALIMKLSFVNLQDLFKKLFNSSLEEYTLMSTSLP